MDAIINLQTIDGFWESNETLSQIAAASGKALTLSPPDSFAP